MKKAGCLVLFALPAIVFVYAVYTAASRFEAASISVGRKAGKEDRRLAAPKPASLAEADARQREMDTAAIQRLLVDRDERLARQAAEQVAGAHAASVSCRAVARTPTQQSASAAWWSVDFECRRTGERAADKTSVSVRLAKKDEEWVLD